MRNLIERIQHIISGGQDADRHPRQHGFDLVKSHKGILRELQISMESGNVVGLVSRALGGGMFLIAVKAIETQDSQEIIIYKKYNFGDGSLLASGRLDIKDIDAVCPLLARKPVLVMPCF